MSMFAQLPRPNIQNLLPVSILAFVIATMTFQPWNALFKEHPQRNNDRMIPTTIGDLRSADNLPEKVVLEAIVEKINVTKDNTVAVITLADTENKRFKCVIHVPANEAKPGIGESQWFSGNPVRVDGKIQIVAGRWLRSHKTAGLKTEKSIKKPSIAAR